MACPRCMNGSGLCIDCEEYLYGENNMANGTHEVAVFEREGLFRAKVYSTMSSRAYEVYEIESEEADSLGEALSDLGERLIAEGL